MDDVARRSPGYGIVLLLILGSMALTTATTPDDVLGSVVVAARGATLVAVVVTAGLHGRVVVATWVLVILAVLNAIGWSVVGSVPLDEGVVPIIDVLLVAAAPVVIARDLARDPVINRQTVSGALCIYLLIGLFFASAYGVVASVGDAPLFISGDGTAADRLYFSMVTLTTTGYGDLVPGTGTMRTAAMVEALMGQLYLVTVVALVVGRLGHERGPRTPDDAS